MNVLLPQPDGPMNAVTAFLWTSERRLAERECARVAHGQLVDVEDDVARPHVGRRRPRKLTDLEAVDSRCGGGLVHDRHEHAFVPTSMVRVSWA